MIAQRYQIGRCEDVAGRRDGQIYERRYQYGPRFQFQFDIDSYDQVGRRRPRRVFRGAGFVPGPLVKRV